MARFKEITLRTAVIVLNGAVWMLCRHPEWHEIVSSASRREEQLGMTRTKLLNWNPEGCCALALAKQNTQTSSRLNIIVCESFSKNPVKKWRTSHKHYSGIRSV